jgi:hypothetical protein
LLGGESYRRAIESLAEKIAKPEGGGLLRGHLAALWASFKSFPPTGLITIASRPAPWRGVARSNSDRKAKLEHFDNRKSDTLRL